MFLHNKRTVSLCQEIEREKIERGIDTIYLGSDIELGGLEIALTRENIKEFENFMLKLPFILKEILAEIAKHRSSLLRDSRVLGDNINGMY